MPPSPRNRRTPTAPKDLALATPVPAAPEQSMSGPDLPQPIPHPDPQARQRAIDQICKACQTCTQAVQMMCSLDHDFAARLTACRSVNEATTVCSNWMAHRVDSLFSVQSRLTEIWLEYSAALLAHHVTQASGRKSDME
jgi:hypothetical protein